MGGLHVDASRSCAAPLLILRKSGGAGEVDASPGWRSGLPSAPLWIFRMGGGSFEGDDDAGFGESPQSRLKLIDVRCQLRARRLIAERGEGVVSRLVVRDSSGRAHESVNRRE